MNNIVSKYEYAMYRSFKKNNICIIKLMILVKNKICVDNK